MICKSFLTDSRVHYYYKVNEGLAAARQDGIERATGEYIGFVDSDDWCELTMFEKMYQAAKSNDSDIVFCNCYENVEKMNPKYYRTGSYDREQIESEIFPHLLISIDDKGKRHNARWSNCLRIYKSKLINEHHISFVRRLRRSQDLQFTFECTIYAQNYYYLGDDYLYHNRQEGGSLSRGYTNKMWILIKPLIQRIAQVANEYKEYDFKSLSETTAFFLVADCILNELKVDSPSLINKMKNIQEIVNDPLCIEYINKVDGSKLSLSWKTIYNCAKTKKIIKFLIRWKWNNSLIRKNVKSLKNKLFEIQLFKKLYIKIRTFFNKNYKPKK